ncbi:CKLF-like MARVEL transmembrane domain-containing protein 4 [Homarus americanus]|uniref:CKLF-like MARVEL transmembrane domain-containing protein 4-like n=1 Tax=Homarus americanus TaxID=6706 RepID=A0A8J5MRY6_HOMAM|nr:CKLF-like MARVEL transmembrane domain-containing protein 4 [Homarus americanus]XP_042235779.1 CKLF-like MARVEL transmembrane domain-containing protein 4 [Homarus americanus]XP_042235780.1 CKLF-like MARVEL transmembrane domain-containing protein 4 [Homarus americanus]KAG7161242.1 CKLF-like MARVEL transmembrane domain-containing protein 4-like [Homarus americanus]
MEAQFPATHTTETAPQDNAENKRIYINRGYMHTNEGRLKIVHMVVCIVVFICVMASDFPRSSPANWISFVAMSGFWTSAVLLFLFIINVVALLSIIPWFMLEFGYTVIWTFFWFVSGCVAADYTVRGAGDAFAVAAFFSFVAMCIYGFTAFLFYKKFREGGFKLPFVVRTSSGISNADPRAASSTTTTTTTTVIQEKY